MDNKWRNIIDESIATRRYLHQHPELSWQEHNTAETIRQKLTALEIPFRVCAVTGTVATLKGKSNKKHIALRGDIDALPINEKTGAEYSSKNEKVMHACGHDGHASALLAIARWVKENQDQLEDTVSFIFQPAEEGGHGARDMIEDGALEGIDEIYGWHNWPAIPFGKMMCPDSIVMCGNGTFRIEVNGVGGHASQPEKCADPILAASAMILNLQQIASRLTAPQKPVVVAITSFEAPSIETITPEQAILKGSIRISDKESGDFVIQQIEKIIKATAEAYNVGVEVIMFPRYGATINHRAQAQIARQYWALDHGEDSLESGQLSPLMASEDFSYYLTEIPGAFAIIGADDGEGHHYACHNPHYDFNDKLIEPVVKWFSRIVGIDPP